MLTEIQVRQLLEDKRIALAQIEDRLVTMYHDPNSVIWEITQTRDEADQLEVQIAVLNYILIA